MSAFLTDQCVANKDKREEVGICASPASINFSDPSAAPYGQLRVGPAEGGWVTHQTQEL